MSKEPVQGPDSPVFRILQDSKAKMQDSKRFFVGFFMILRRKIPDSLWESIGEYGWSVIPAIGWNTFSENSAHQRPI